MRMLGGVSLTCTELCSGFTRFWREARCVLSKFSAEVGARALSDLTRSVVIKTECRERKKY